MTTKRIAALLLTALLAAAGSSACTATDNCATRGDCNEVIRIVRPPSDDDPHWLIAEMTRLEAEVSGLWMWEERPAADTLAACDFEEC